jgi:hypothetical protein
MSVTPAVFEGYDTYMVEIEGVDGKSYDAYVALDGTLLGHDEYELVDEDAPEPQVKAEGEEVLEEKSSEGDLEEGSEEPETKEYDEDDIEFKKFYSAEQRRSFARRGWSLPDGSFPIKDGQDLKNAIRLAGNSNNPDAAKAHIMKRAAQLGLEKLIPETWLPKAKKKADGAEADTFEKDLMEFQMMQLDEDENPGE